MRSKKVLKYGFLIASFAIAGAVAACSAGDGGNSNNGKEKIVFTWSEVAQSETTEAGSDYIFALPEVTANGEAAEISVTVKKDGKSVPNDGEKFYVEETGEYTIVYTAEHAGASEEKSVALKSQDTTAPKAVFTLPSAIKYDIPVNFGDKIRVKDNLANNLDESSVSYKLYDTTGGGERLLTEEFDEAQKQFVIENPEIKSVRLTVFASDKSGNAGSTSLDITMLPLLDYGAFDFSGFEAGALADKPISGLSFSGFSESDLKEIAFDESENKNILKLQIAESAVKDTRWATVRFTKDLLGDFTAFDYVTLRMRVTYDSTGGFVGFGGSYGYQSQYKYALPASGAWATYRFDSANTLAALGKTDIPLTFAMYSDKTKSGNYTIEIAEIKGAYKEISIDENGIDLTQKFGLAQNEFSATFTDIDGNGSTVADVTNFNSNVAGTLAVTVNKAGYAQSQFETKISIVSHYGNLLNLSAYKVGSAYSDTATVVDYNGKKALQVVNSGAESSTVRVNIVSDAVLDLKKFDYIRVKVAMKYENASANVNLTLVDSKGSQYAWKNVGGGNNKFIESTVDVATANMTMTSNSLGVTFKKWIAALQTSIITDLYCGYNDITTDSETTLDLTKKLGLAASDFTATFTPENGEEQAVEKVDAVDISAAGTLKITVKKSGYAATVLTIGVKAAS